MPVSPESGRKFRVVDPALAQQQQQQRTARPASSTKSKLPKNPHDIRQTKEYKLAARRWTSTIVALPILLYTSYMLYDRTYGNKSPKRVDRPQQEQQSSTSS